MTVQGSFSGQRHDHCTPGVRHHVLAAAACGVTDFIKSQGGQPDQVLQRAGVPEQNLDQPTLALDLGAYVRMMEVAAEETGNENFGLHYGRHFQPGMLGLIGAIALAAPTLGAALENFARLFPFHQQATETRFYRDGEFLRLEYRILNGSIVERRQDAELTLGMFANVVRACLGAGWMPEEVHFEHARPGEWRQHQSVFDAPVHFGQRTNALLLRDRDLNARMPAGDLARLTALTNSLVGVAKNTGELSLVDRVKTEIRGHLSTGYAHIEEVAEALDIPRWTLQRRLAEDGVIFSELMEQVRRELSMVYIRQHHIPIADIGFLLGYSEVSAFSRAFRRWFGVSPNGMRQQFRILPSAGLSH